MRQLPRFALPGFLLAIIVGLLVVIAVRERRISDLKDERTRRSAEPLRLSRMLTADPRATPPSHLDLTGEDRAFLKHVLAEIFPGGTAALDEQAQCIEIARYVASRLKLRNTVGTATDCLRSGQAICGGMAVTFAALCREVSIPARKVGIYNMPRIGGHAVAEAFYDDTWHFFDPTFGVFFGSGSEYRGDSTIPSLAELFEAPERWQLFRVVEQPWTGTYDDAVRSQPVTPVEDSYLRARFRHVLSEQYVTGLRVAFPIEEREPLLSFPLTADLREQRVATIGTVNGSDLDLWAAGHYHLGPNGFHTWTIRGAKNQRVRIEYTTLAPPSTPIAIVPLKAVRSARVIVDGNTQTMSFHSSDDEALVAVFAEANTPLETIRIVREPVDASSLPPSSPPKVLANQESPIRR